MVEPVANVEQRPTAAKPDRALAVVTPLLALGAVALYAIGVLSTAGKLRAADIPIEQTFALASLQQHLVNGLGVLLEPGSLGILAFLGLFFGIVFLSYAVLDRRMSSDEDVGPTPYRALWPTALLSAVLVLAGGFIAPLYALMLLLAGTPVLLLFRVIHNHFPEFYLRRRALIYPASLLILVSVQLGLEAYFGASPPPRVTVTTDRGNVRGLLVARDGQYVFVHAGDDSYIGIAGTEIKRFVVSKPAPTDDDPSLFRAIGLPFGR